jgi:hypothetical protein
MSECARELSWAGGKHRFDLNTPWVRQNLAMRGLPGQFGDTPAACLKRFDEGVYSQQDVERVIYLGLIGGGTADADARKLVRDHVAIGPISPNAVLAFEVLTALFIGAANANASS